MEKPERSPKEAWAQIQRMESNCPVCKERFEDLKAVTGLSSRASVEKSPSGEAYAEPPGYARALEVHARDRHEQIITALAKQAGLLR